MRPKSRRAPAFPSKTKIISTASGGLGPGFLAAEDEDWRPPDPPAGVQCAAESGSAATEFDPEPTEEFSPDHTTRLVALIREEIHPESAIELFVASRVLQWVRRLRKATGLRWQRGRNRYYERVCDTHEAQLEEALYRSLEALADYRSRLKGIERATSQAASCPESPPQAASPGDPVSSPAASIPAQPAPPSEAADPVAGPSVRWRDRLAIDAAVSEQSPVVRGTWVTVSQVVSLVVDGWTWADILRAHPELTEEDIRACLWYSVTEDNASLPL